MSTSSPAHRIPSRHRQVDELVRTYSKTKDPSAPLRDILRRPEQASLLVHAVGRQISLIKNRSLAFDDGQVTVYDRALLVLSQDGRALTDHRALELFATEYLGMLASAHNASEMKNIEAQYALCRVSDTYGLEASRITDNRLHRESSTTSPRKQPSHQDQHENRSRSPAVQSLTKASVSNTQHRQAEQNQDQARNDPLHDHVDRILTIYHRAQKDYHRTRCSEDVEPLSAIRFLRDTAENTILYLRANGLFDHASLPELEGTFQWSKDKAAELSGGRKRHFDYDDGDYNGKGEVEEEGRALGAAGGRKHGAKKRKGKVRRALIDSYRP